MSRRTEFRNALKQVRFRVRKLEPWMVDNFVDLEREYGSGRLNLRELAEVVRALGLTNANGGPLTEATISKTWARIRERMAQASTPQVAPLNFPPGVVVLPMPTTTDDRCRAPIASSDDRRLRRGGPLPKVVVAPAPEALDPDAAPRASPMPFAIQNADPVAGLSADEQIARFRRDQRAGVRSMPGSIEIAIKQ